MNGVREILDHMNGPNRWFLGALPPDNEYSNSSQERSGTYREHLVDFRFPPRVGGQNVFLLRVNDPFVRVSCALGIGDRDECDEVQIFAMRDGVGDDMLEALR